MSYEVVHTSVLKGLRGETGFATAVVTRGIPAGLESGLEDISGYDHDDSRAVGADSVEWAHRVVTIRGRAHTVLSRIAPNGVDASRRPNRIAHHLVLEPEDRTSAGPAWVLDRYQAFETGTPEVSERGAQPVLPIGELAARPARAWELAGFDPGWAGVVAQALLDAPHSVVYVVLPKSMGVLPLVLDVMALLPVDRRWHVTFSTRPLVMLPHVRCQLRFIRQGVPGIERMLAEPGARAIRIEIGVEAGAVPAAEAARLGRQVEPSVRAASMKVHPTFAKSTLTAAKVVVESSAAPSRPQGGFGSAPAAEASIAPWDARGRRADASDADAEAAPDARLSSSSAGRWPPIAIVLLIYSGIAVLGAVILFLLAAFSRR
jgi:hypothetical protein